MKKYVGLITAGVLSIGMLAGCNNANGANAKSSKTLVMGTSADYKPYEYVDTTKSDKIIGFDIDLANELAKRTGYKIQVKDLDFNSLITAMKGGQVDMVMAGMNATPERKQNADFTQPYFSDQNEVIVKNGSNIKSLADLKGKTIGVQAGTVQESIANAVAKKGGYTVQNRNRVPELIEELKAGRFDAVIIEQSVAAGYLNNLKDLNGVLIKEFIDNTTGSAIAFPKNSNLTPKFNEAITEVKKDGTLNKLVKKWFGISK